MISSPLRLSDDFCTVVGILIAAATRIPDIKHVTAITRVANFDPVVILVV